MCLYHIKESRRGAARAARDSEVAETVRKIIADVARDGEAAVRKYSLQFDGFSPASFKLTEDEIAQYVAGCPEQAKRDIAFAQAQIRNFAARQKACLTDLEVETHPGVFLGHRNIPVESAACYVPGGRYPLVASAHMGIVTAKVAGVARVVGITPAYEGKPHPVTITAMAMAGADEIHVIGGAQALAAAAHGAGELKPVDMIVGPGNAYVAEAKRQLFGTVGIDLLAGPTEVLIIADESADPEMVAVDLLGQAEHGPDSPAILVTTSPDLGLAVLQEIERQLLSLETAAIAGAAWRDFGEVIVVESPAEAVAISDKHASEHVEVLAADLAYYQASLSNYGSLFLGDMTTVAYGDKVIGTNHTLPTRRGARYTGGLWVGKFLRTCTFQRIEKAEASVLFGEYGSRLCALENFAGHQRQMDIRVENFGKQSRSAWRRDAASGG